MKFVISILAVMLFCCGYQICSFFYPNFCKNPEALAAWWDLRMNLYAMLILLLFWLSNMKNGQSKHVSFVLAIGIGLSISDVLDRVYFDITKFTLSDIFMIVITIMVSYAEVYAKFNINNIQKLCHLLKLKK